MKATFIGTCQLCGREQKLPNGRLSKHGYTVEWHMFNGTCPGAHGLPFEQSTDLIEAAIGRAKDTVVRLTAMANELETDADPKAVWVHEYRPATWERGNRHSSYVWRKLDIAKDVTVRDAGYDRPDGTRHALWSPEYESQWSRRKDKMEPVFGSPGWSSDVIAGYRAANVRYATSLRREVVEYERYIKWQTERVANWKPQELKPVAA